jgi:hypothetical protein
MSRFPSWMRGRHSIAFILLVAAAFAAALTGGLVALIVTNTPVRVPIQIERVCPAGTTSYTPFDIRVNGTVMKLGCNDPITTYGETSIR